MALAEASVLIIPDTKGFAQRLEDGIRAALKGVEDMVEDTTEDIEDKFKESSKESSKAVGGIGDEFKKLGKLIAGAAIGRAVVGFAKDSIAAASDLGESINAVQVTFGDLSDEILEFSKTSARSVGLASADFNSFAVRFAGFTKQIATGSQTAADVTEELTTRIADFASVMNLDLNEAATVFASTLAGESEAIRRFGIDMSAASIEAYALANGMIASKDEMTASIKVQATYAKLMEDTNQVAGDFANTSDSLANRQRILAAEFKDAQVAVGQALIPTLNSLLGVVGDVVGAFSALPTDVQNVITIVGLAGGAFIGLSSALQGVGLAAGTANKLLGGVGLAITAVVVLYKAFDNIGKAAEERQNRLNDALVKADDPAATLITRVQTLVDQYNELNPAAENATDGIDAIAGAIDFVRAETLKYLPVLSDFGADLDAITDSVQTGTDDFEDLRNSVSSLFDSATRGNSTAESFNRIAVAIENVVDEGNPLRDVLLDIAKSGDLTNAEFIAMLSSLDDTADAFDDNREEINKQAEALLKSADGARAFAGALGDDVYARLVATADETGDYTQTLEHLETLLRNSGKAYDTTTGEIVEFAEATDESAAASNEAAEALKKQEEALNDLLDATLGAFNADIAYEQQKRATKDAIDAFTVAQQNLTNGTKPAAEAARDYAEATEDVYLETIKQAEASANAARELALKSGADLTAQQSAKIHREEIDKVAATLAPNSPMRLRLRDFSLELSRIERNININIKTIFTEERRVSNIGRAMADGGLVSSPTVALIGEAGPEVVIPLTRPQRAMELMQQTGLMAYGSQQVSGGRGAAVNIESANFYDGTDANLVAQKVNAAQQARSFSR